MNIGIVTTWFERGAAYVSRIYMSILIDEGHNVLIYARGGEVPPQNAEKWNEPYVTRDTMYQNSRVNSKQFFRWIKNNKIEAVFFNEQQDFRIVAETKKKFPDVKLGAYVDYYTEKTRKWFNLYDFLICNTNRHMQAMADHPQKYYVKWGTDIELYKPTHDLHREITFFHSVGMSTRKGTDILIDAFIDGELYEKSALVIHTQIPIERVCKYDKSHLEKYGIQIIEKTVTAPGLYYMGDVYVYPTRLDGLGLTMYEALASGLPVITSDFPPMNEAVNSDIGQLVKINDYYCRQDAYYYPMVICDKNDLIRCMKKYIDDPTLLSRHKENSRKYAEENYNITKAGKIVTEIFTKSAIKQLDTNVFSEVMRYYKKELNTFYQWTETYTRAYNAKCKTLSTIQKIKGKGK